MTTAIAPETLAALMQAKCRIRRRCVYRTHKRKNFDGYILDTTLGRALEVIKEVAESDSKMLGFVSQEFHSSGLFVTSHYVRSVDDPYDLKYAITSVELDGVWRN